MAKNTIFLVENNRNGIKEIWVSMKDASERLGISVNTVRCYFCRHPEADEYLAEDSVITKMVLNRSKSKIRRRA